MKIWKPSTAGESGGRKSHKNRTATLSGSVSIWFLKGPQQWQPGKVNNEAREDNRQSKALLI